MIDFSLCDFTKESIQKSVSDYLNNQIQIIQANSKFCFYSSLDPEYIYKIPYTYNKLQLSLELYDKAEKEKLDKYFLKQELIYSNNCIEIFRQRIVKPLKNLIIFPNKNNIKNYTKINDLIKLSKIEELYPKDLNFDFFYYWLSLIENEEEINHLLNFCYENRVRDTASCANLGIDKTQPVIIDYDDCLTPKNM